MKKFLTKKSEPGDLNFQWPVNDHQLPLACPAKKTESGLSRFDEYFEFLEEIGPLPADRNPSIIYKEIFSL